MRSPRDLGEWLRRQLVKDTTELPLARTLTPVSIVTDDRNLTTPLRPESAICGTDVSARGAGLFSFLSLVPNVPVRVVRVSGQVDNQVVNEAACVVTIQNIAVYQALAPARAATSPLQVGDQSKSGTVSFCQTGGIGDQFNPIGYPIFNGSPISVDWLVSPPNVLIIVAQVVNTKAWFGLEWQEQH